MNNDTTVQHITEKVLLIKSNGGNYANTLYTLLIQSPCVFSVEDMCNIADSLGFEQGKCYDFRIINAIICSKELLTRDIYYILKYVNFDTELCELTFEYYKNTNLHMKILKKRQQKMQLSGQNDLLAAAEKNAPLPTDFLATLIITPPGYSHDMPSGVTM